MDDTSLNSILSDQPEQVETAESTQVETVETKEPADTGETTAPPAEVKEEDPIEKHRKGLEAAVVAERQKRQVAERRIAELEQKAPKETPAEKPQLSQFKTQEEYLAAVADHEADRAWKQREQQAAEEAKQRAEDDHRANVQRTADEIVKKGQSKYTDFDPVINEGLGPFLNPAMHQALLLGESGHDVAYWLGKNPAEASRVSGLAPFQMVREIALIESRLRTEPESEKLSIPKTLTQERDARGRFEPAYVGPTPLDDILANKR